MEKNIKLDLLFFYQKIIVFNILYEVRFFFLH